MNLVDCYSRIGGKYQDAKSRFLDDSRIKKFLKMFLRDSSFVNLQASILRRDYKDAFMYAHTLKGILLNLSLDSLSDLCSELVEMLRVDDINEDEALYIFELLKEKYGSAVGELNNFFEKEEER